MSLAMPDLATAIADLFTGSPATLADPYPRYRDLQAAGAMHWIGDAGGPGPWSHAWHVLGYAEVAAALKDRRFGAHRMPAPPPATPGTLSPAEHDSAELGRIFGLTLLYLDPPHHTRLRLLTAQTFTRRVGGALRPRIQTMVNGLLDRVEAQRAFDIVADLATPLPILVVAELLGIPHAERAHFAQCSGGIMTLAPTPQAMTNALDLVRTFRALMLHRRRDPGDDLISDLVRAQAENDALTDDEIMAQCLTVVIAGTETTTAAISTGILTLLRHPQAWAALSETGIERVVEELLRFAGPTHLLPREAREEVEIGGRMIQAGQRLWLWVAAANRDPARFPRADTFDGERTDVRHLAFGSGIHACIGAALARLEMQVVLLTLRERYPAMRLVDTDVPWSPNSALRSPQRLRVARV